MPSQLAGRAMLVALHLNKWEARRLDKMLGEEAEAKHGAKKGTVKSHKYLVPKEELEGVTQAHRAARDAHYAHTLPWGDSSVRIISSAAYLTPYVPTMSTHRDACLAAHRQFVAKYPQLRAEAPVRMNGLYRDKDFPKDSAIAGKFGFDIDILPVPETDDFRVVDLGAAQDEAERLVEETIMRRNQEAMQEVYHRVLEPLRHFVATMRKKGKAKFHDTTVEKLIDAAKAMPRLALVPDANLEAECAAIVAELEYDPKRLRQRPALRTEAAKKAEARLKQIEAAMQGAFA